MKSIDSAVLVRRPPRDVARVGVVAHHAFLRVLPLAAVERELVVARVAVGDVDHDAARPRLAAVHGSVEDGIEGRLGEGRRVRRAPGSRVTVRRASMLKVQVPVASAGIAWVNV